VNPDGQDTSRQLNKDDVPTLQQDLQFIERQIKEITIEVEHAKRQEAYLNQANGKLFSCMFHGTHSMLIFCIELTQSRLEWFSYLSMAVLLGTAIWQIWYLRSFFSAKKLL
jgi:hypothetical protein